jgi:hypothetical protein
MSSDDLKTLIAAWGAITGTIGVTIGSLAMLRDRSRLQIRLTLMPRREALEVSEQLGKRRNEQFVFAEVVNVGRRPRHVYRAELWVAACDNLLVHQDTDFVFTGDAWSQPGESWKSWRLEEGQSITFVFGVAEQYEYLRVDVPDSLAHNIKNYAGYRGRLRWWYGRWRGRKGWKEMRDLMIEQKRTRHYHEG